MWRYVIRRFSTEHPKINPLQYPNPGHSAYGGPIQVEFDHVRSSEEKDWLLSNYEKLMESPFKASQKIQTLRLLQMAESFERFTHKKFSTYKRYSGEGLEALVPSIYSVLESQHGVSPNSSVIMSIAHRGKLAVLTSIMNYPIRNLFWKIKGNSVLPTQLNEQEFYFTDDISTHIAVTSERPELKGLRISMLHNPSHLEIGGAVGLGKTKSKIDAGKEALHLWIHGDAALAGQGVVYETSQMANLPGFSVNGCIHIVANNQVGFTTPENLGRSSPYCTDVFKIIGAPILRVNAYSPEEVVKAGQLAVEYRKVFKNDFAIDLIGYRKYGHNEVDEPSFTNPLMYKVIREEMKGCATHYAEQLMTEGVINEKVYEKMKKQLDEHLTKEFEASNIEGLEKDEKGWIKVDSFKDQWAGISPFHKKGHIETGIEIGKLKEIAEITVNIPENIKVHPLIIKGHIGNRKANLAEGKADWATAEAMAFGSLLQEGYNVRICGEDTVRGTYSQRHAGYYCQDSEKLFIPFEHLKPGKFTVVNSFLSELAVLGFEYGYSLDDPKHLVLWEAQYGDFSNMAQPIIDTYIASGEAKWFRQSGLVLLLPNGQEGAGPDHSSARIGRCLELVNNLQATQLNIQVANCIIPSNYFHLLREQVIRNFRRPLILGTPKSALRSKLLLSDLESMGPGTSFKPFFFKDINGGRSDKLFICNGKIYVELLQQFQQDKISILLIEELSPFPYEELHAELSKRGFPEKAIFVQEEPANTGVFRYIEPQLRKLFGGNVDLISRLGLGCSSEGNSRDFKAHQEGIYQSIRNHFYDS